MAISFLEVLKEVENGSRIGYQKDKGWYPHKSPEGGTRTIGYGHKLSPKEDKGDYVELPNGDVVDLSDRGLTDEEIDMIFISDLSKSRKIAEKQWNKFQDKDFNSLPTVYQNVLTELVFNVGTLKNRNGKFGWPSLAKGIKNGDNEVVKKEIMRSYTDGKTGKKVPLTGRVDKIRAYIDNPDLSSDIFTPQEQPLTYPQVNPTGFLDNLTEILRQRLNQPQEQSEVPSGEVIDSAEVRSTTKDDIVDALVKANLSKKELNEAKLKRTYDEARLEAEYKDLDGTPGYGSKRIIDEMSKMEVVKSVIFDRSSLNEDKLPLNSETSGETDDSKDPIYGLF